MGFSQGIMPNKSSFITGHLDVATAGVAEQLSEDSVPVPDGCEITIIAKPDNEGYIYLGNSKDNAEAASKFDGLSAGLAVAEPVNDANLFWVNSSEDGEGVSYIIPQ